MHALQIRDVPDELYLKLKDVSHRNHRSIAREALSILEKHLIASSPEAGNNIFAQIDSVREDIQQTYGVSASSVQLIREDRQQ